MKEFQLASTKKILLISAKPAPNGGLHLGHIAGPYLRQDMLRRHYKMRGASVTVVGGTDPVDSFISLRAVQDELKPSNVAQHYYRQIMQDFTSYDIHFDRFIDPLSEEWRERYIDCFVKVVDRAVVDDKVIEQARPFPFFVDQLQRGASGAWLCGACPDCNDSVSGYFCEACGAHFDPEEVIQPVPREGQSELAFLPTNDLFFNITDSKNLLQQLSSIQVSPSLLAIVKRHFDKGRHKIRLTERSDWGISTKEPIQRQYFGHGLLYGYCRLLGELYQEISGALINPFDEGSDVISVNLFGIDNTVSHMVNIQAIGSSVTGWKGFDAFVVNRFYLLEGKKFSTSARHLIWAHELIHTSKADSDAVRFVISATSPTETEKNLSTTEFCYWYNDVYVARLQSVVMSEVESLQGTNFQSVPNHVVEGFHPLWQQVCLGHEFSKYHPEKQIDFILKWLEARTKFTDESYESKYGWLMCMLLLLYPIAPKLATWAWTSLGHLGEPNLAGFFNNTSVSITRPRIATKPMGIDDLFRAIPETAATRIMASV